jgi:Mycothiol maleylpyruvate isomerase N-terminal domain
VAVDPRAAFLDAAALASALVASREVAARWSEPSALEQLSVGGLAGHTYLAARILLRSLDAPDPAGLPIASPTAGGLLRMRVTSHSDLMRDDHARVRSDGEYVARRGPEAVAGKFDELTSRLRARLPTEPADRVVRAPANDVAYRLDDWAISRTTEMLVHADDLAVSVGLDPVVLPADAALVAIGCLVEMSRHREGDLAVLRALSRRERADTELLRAL